MDIIETLDRIGVACMPLIMQYIDLIQRLYPYRLLYVTALHNSSWSIMVYDYKSAHIQQTYQLLASSGAGIIDKSGNIKYTKHYRTYQVQLRHLCRNISITAAISNTNTTASSTSTEKKCVDLLQDLRNEGDNDM